MSMPTIKVRRLTPSAILPTKGHVDDLAWDIYSDKVRPSDSSHFFPNGPGVDDQGRYSIPPGYTCLVPTGIAVQPPDGYGFVLRERSSQARAGVHVQAGVVDPGYTGEWLVVLHNAGRVYAEFKPGDRVAQAILVPLVPAVVEEVQELNETTRGSGGFGSTGR